MPEVYLSAYLDDNAVPLAERCSAAWTELTREGVDVVLRSKAACFLLYRALDKKTAASKDLYNASLAHLEWLRTNHRHPIERERWRNSLSLALSYAGLLLYDEPMEVAAARLEYLLDPRLLCANPAGATNAVRGAAIIALVALIQGRAATAQLAITASQNIYRSSALTIAFTGCAPCLGDELVLLAEALRICLYLNEPERSVARITSACRDDFFGSVVKLLAPKLPS